MRLTGLLNHPRRLCLFGLRYRRPFVIWDVRLNSASCYWRGGVAVSPGVGFGEHGEGFVRFGLIENEHRTRQAIRGIKKVLRQRPCCSKGLSARDSPNIGVCGVGTVGLATMDILMRQAEALRARSGMSMKLVHVGARREHADHDYGSARVSRDVMALSEDPEIDVLVELIGGHQCGLRSDKACDPTGQTYRDGQQGADC